ncbi:hypothetical protein OIO90_002923 [Microbotryomycetes sp. JL221]|nr:hypothetical protein OIO90_002923 [Microbotryomycetes sp. JL221]
MSEAPPLRVAVIGGGIAGLAATTAFLKLKDEGANIDIQVYEAAPVFAEIGAGVSFGPNAQRALRMMGAGDALDAVAGPPGDDADLWFHFVVAEAGKDSGKDIMEVRGVDAARGNVHRADFLDQLIRRVPKQVAHFHHRLSSYVPHSNGVTLNFESGQQAECDVLVASDGIKSNTRKCMFERKGLDLDTQKATFSNWVAWRGLITKDKFREIFGHQAKDKMMLCGYRKHILHFPVRNGELINIVGFVQDLDKKKLGDHTGPWAEERPRSEMLKDYSDFNEQCLEMLKCIENPSIWGIFELPDIESCVDDRVLLIGDADHATTPHQGAGAGQALEDALFIAALLSNSKTSSTTLDRRPEAIQKALQVYEQTRHERGVKVKRTSREAGLLYEMCGVDGEGRDTTKMGENLRKRMNWIWDWDTKSELDKALNML